MKNVFYFKDINSIGGVESFFYYLSCLYKNMVVYYKNADVKQVERLAKNVEVRKYKNGEKIICDRFFCNYAPDIINNVEAKEYIHLIHCDYKQTNFSPIIHPKFTKYIGVSQLVCDSFKELTGIKAECIYNPLPPKTVKKQKVSDKLRLISVTRLSSEKGGSRMIKLSELLDKAGIDYEWLVYSNRKNRGWYNPRVKYEKPSLNIIEEIVKADYLVQLSSHEAYCYSVIEAVSCGIPVIITDLPVFKELGLNHGKNAIICDLNMNNVDINMIKNGLPEFEYKPPKSNWGKYLDNNTAYDPNELIEVKAKIKYTDIELERKTKIGEVFKTSKARASYLEAYPVNTQKTGLVEVLR